MFNTPQVIQEKGVYISRKETFLHVVFGVARIVQ